MMRTWHRDGALPASPRALIDQFVSESLLVTNNPDESSRQSRNPEDSRWMERVAGRLAAAMFFCGKPAFSLASEGDAESLTFLELRGEEKWNVELKTVTDQNMRELRTRTSLLRSVSDPPRLVFHSQVVQETLAASWLAAQELSLTKLVGLFSELGSGVFPQLHALAAALAEQQSAFRQWLLEHDPVVLLLADHTGLENHAKQEIVHALLDYTRRIQVVDAAFGRDTLAPWPTTDCWVNCAHGSQTQPPLRQ